MQSKELIFGCWQIGGSPSFRDMSEAEAMKLLEYAYSLGIRSFDTAPIYGFGKSEIYIGKALEHVRKDIRIISKFGYSLEHGRSGFDVSKDGITSQLHASLDRLKTNYLDTYLLHIPERIDDPESIIITLNSLKKKGYIREYGLCNTSGTLLQKFFNTKECEIGVIQDFYNLIDRSAETSIFPYLTESTLFMAYSPLYRGGLSETPMDEILKKGESAFDMLFRNQGLKDFMRDRKLYGMVAAKKGMTLKEFALDFLIKNPHVKSIIYGTSQQEHLKEIYTLFQELGV